MLGGILVVPPMHGLMHAKWLICMFPVQVIKHVGCVCFHANHACVLRVSGLDEIFVELEHLYIFNACIKIKIGRTHTQ